MSTLADLQGQVRQALLTGDVTPLERVLAGTGDPTRRLAIHGRHFAASLTKVLLDRFPATVWLVGSTLIREAARKFVRQHPPTRPCLAEYGEGFPAFLALHVGAYDIPYLSQFAELEWHVGRLSLAVDAPAITLENLSSLNAMALPDATLALQAGLHYLSCDWALDELISLYLADKPPDTFALQQPAQSGSSCTARVARCA
jgi:hypothetical protein